MKFKSGIIAFYQVKDTRFMPNPDYENFQSLMRRVSQALDLELRSRHQASRVHTSSAVVGLVKTPFFKGETNQSHFIMPLMHVDTVGDAIINTLYADFSKNSVLSRDTGVLDLDCESHCSIKGYFKMEGC